MLRTFRRISKTKFGSLIIAFPFLMILGGFALADLQNFGTGNIGFGMSDTTLATVGDESVSGQEMDDAMRLRLDAARQQNPNADYPSIAGEYNSVLKALISQHTLIAFANKIGFRISEPLIGAEIAKIPQTKGLNGQFSEDAYRAFLAQRRMTDAQVRSIITASLIDGLLVAPMSSNPRVSVGMATPFASMMLETREGQAALLPVELFAAGLKPSAQQIQAFYAANRGRYTIPEQRVIRYATISADSVGGATASAKEIEDYYKANAATYGGRELRDLSQVVTSDRKQADAIAARAKGGTALSAAASAVAGAGAAVSELKGQTRQAYADVTSAQAAGAVFGAAQGAVIGPIQSEFGWTVVKVDAVNRVSGKSLESAREEIAAKLNADKRKLAIEDKVDQLQNAIDDGATFAEAAAGAKLAISSTPLITVAGTSVSDKAYRAPADLVPALRGSFEASPNDPPEVVTLPENRGYLLVSTGDIVPAAPPPLASIQARVAADWTASEGLKRAAAAARALSDKLNRGTAFDVALKQVGVDLPPLRPLAARRLEISSSQEAVPAAYQALFSIPQGKSKVVPATGSRGFAVVKVDKIVPGNALLQPGLITRVQGELQAATAEAYAEQFVAAAAKYLGVKTNDKAIADAKKRLTTSPY